MYTELSLKQGSKEISLFLNPTNDRRAQRIIGNSPKHLYPSTFEVWEYLIRSFTWDSIIDVGANYGEMSCSAFLNRTTDDLPIHIFEPSNELMNNLEMTFRKKENIFLHKFALSSTDGPIYFRNFIGNSGKSNVSHTFPVILRSEITIEKVQAKKLDSVSGLGGKILMKIDVEGHEEEVLAGSIHTIRNSNELVIMIEANQVDIEKIVERFPELKPYAYFRLSGKLKPISNRKLRKLRFMQSLNMYHHDILLVKSKDNLKFVKPITSISQRISKITSHMFQIYRMKISND